MLLLLLLPPPVLHNAHTLNSNLPLLTRPPPAAAPERTSRGVTREEARPRNMRRHSSLVTGSQARLSMGELILNSAGQCPHTTHPLSRASLLICVYPVTIVGFYNHVCVSVVVAPPRVAGLGLRADKGVVKGGAGGGAVLAPGTVVQGARTQVMMGSEVDLDRVAASIQTRSPPEPAAEPGAASVSGARQLRSLAGAITGAAANIKSKLASAVTQGSLARSSPSPPDTSQGQGQGRVKMREVPIRVEQGAGQGQGLPGQEKSPHVIPLTVPGAEYGGSLVPLV